MRDSEAIGRAMITLVLDPSYRRRLALNGYQHVTSAYRKDSVVPKYEQVYQRMAYQ